MKNLMTNRGGGGVVCVSDVSSPLPPSDREFNKNVLKLKFDIYGELVRQKVPQMINVVFFCLFGVRGGGGIRLPVA